MKKAAITFLFFVIATICVFSQRENAWWYFGFNTGLNFNEVLDGTATIPEKVTGPIFTSEGCFSISDYDGNFLMASDGIKVYNKDRLVMDNGTGLKGDPSSSQSGIIIPRPGYANQFFIVTVPNWAHTADGIQYSIVDLNQNSGLGEVMDKNIPLTLDGTYPDDHIYENIAAVIHYDRKNYWLVHRARGHFFAWLVTKDGIGPTPERTSAIGYDPGQGVKGNDTSPGNLKFSSDGTRILHTGWGGMALGNFNNRTGEVSNISFTEKTSTIRPYSAEFSPDGNHIYFSDTRAAPYNLYRLSANQSISGQAPVLLGSGYRSYGLQLGPNGKIYGTDYRTTNLSLIVINNPNEGGSDINNYINFFDDTELNQSGRESALNLPTFTNSNFVLENPRIDPPEICLTGSNSYSMDIFIAGAVVIDHIEWDFGDGTIVNSTDLSGGTISVTHRYKKRGHYTVKVTPYRDAAKTKPVNNRIATIPIHAKSCRIPVNHNISVMGYE